MASTRHRSPRPSAQLLALLAMAVPGAGFAQTTGNATLPTVTVKEAPEVPYKADSSANPKFTAPLIDTPKTITVIKKEVLEEQGAVTLMEALRNTPGITMQMGENGNSTAGDSFQLRGFSLQQSTFVDGIRDLGAVTRDTFNLEQVEVFKGSAGAETGRSAASGFINLVSKQAHLGDENNASVSVGTGDRRRATVDLNKQLGNESAIRINGMVQKSGVDGRDYVENQGTGLGLSYAHGLDTPTRVHLFSQHIRQKNVPDGGIPSIGFEGFYNASALVNGAPKVSRENFYGSPNDREKIEADMFTAKIEHDLSAETTVRNITRWGKNHNDRTLTGITGLITAPNAANPGVVAGDPATWAVSRSRQRVDQENTIFANQTSVNTEFSAGGMQHSLAAGVELMHEKQVSFDHGAATPATPAANLYRPNPSDPMGSFGARTGQQSGGTTNTIGAYVFDTAKLNEQWSLNGGLRVDRYRIETRNIDETGLSSLKDSRSLVSWSVGSIYKPAENGSVYASYGTSQTPPGGNNFQLSETAGNQNNAALDPQETENIELGTKWELMNKRLNLAAAVFRINNEGQTSQDPVTGEVFQYGKTRVQGLELSAVGQITNFWQLSAGLAKTSTKQLDQRSRNATTGAVTVNEGVRWSPDLTATLWTSYQLDKLTLGLGARYTSKQKRLISAGSSAATTVMPEIPSSWVADAMVGYQFTDKVSLRLNVYNLFDEEYISTLNNGGGRLALGVPRSATLTANFKF